MRNPQDPPQAETAEIPPATLPAGGGCFYCGSELAPAARYCKECEKYQPEDRAAAELSFATVNCRICGERLPGKASKCNHCGTFLSGYRRWLPTSAAGVSTLAAVASTLVLLVNTWISWPEDLASRTIAALAGSNSSTLQISFVNRGTAASSVGHAWARLASECGGSKEPPPLCRDAGAPPPPGVIPLKAMVEEGDYQIAPGERSLPFRSSSFLRADDYPPALEADCSNYAEAVERLRLCVVVRVFEYSEHADGSETEDYCQYLNVGASKVLSFVDGITGCR
jgi:hypothetical protein